jgi:hypothetical protein
MIDGHIPISRIDARRPVLNKSKSPDNNSCRPTEVLLMGVILSGLTAPSILKLIEVSTLEHPCECQGSTMSSRLTDTPVER